MYNSVCVAPPSDKSAVYRSVLLYDLFMRLGVQSSGIRRDTHVHSARMSCQWNLPFSPCPRAMLLGIEGEKMLPKLNMVRKYALDMLKGNGVVCEADLRFCVNNTFVMEEPNLRSS